MYININDKIKFFNSSYIGMWFVTINNKKIIFKNPIDKTNFTQKFLTCLKENVSYFDITDYLRVNKIKVEITTNEEQS